MMISLKELQKAQIQKKRGKDFPLMTGYLVHRAISIHLTRLLLTFFPSLRGNTVSWWMIFISLSGIWLIGYADMLALFGLILVYIGFLLDKVDGEVARSQKEITLRGGFLDEMYHLLVPNALLGMIFLPFLLEGGIHAVLAAMAIFFNVSARMVRKISLAVYVKHEARIKRNEVYIPKKARKIPVLLNFVPFKLASIIERFDVVLLVLTAVIVLETVMAVSIRDYFLYTYTIAAVVYTLRLILLYYFSNVENEALRLQTTGY